MFFPKRSKKNLRFQKYPDTCERGFNVTSIRLETQSYGVTILSIFSVKSDDVTIPYESSLAVICAICLK